MKETVSASVVDFLTETLIKKKFVCADNFLPNDLFIKLCREVRREEIEGITRPAKIGRLAKARLNQDIRGDRIRWITKETSPAAIQPALDIFDDLRKHLRVNLLLPLHNIEQHFAVYPPGASYKKHLDCHRNSNSRLITYILYLNRRNWSYTKGGKLKVWTEKDRTEEYLPLGNRLILFYSPDFYHAVLPAACHRYSMTGWFRRKPPLL